MALGSINIVTATRAQDFTTIKQNEDNKMAVTQMNINRQEDKQLKLRSQQVVEKEETKWQQKKFDAKEKGSNEYNGDGGKRRHEKQNDQVVIKGQQSFDIKV